MEVKEKEDLISTKEELNVDIENYNETKNHSDFIIIFGYLFIIFILILSITFCIFSLLNTNTENIVSGVYIKGIDVSALTKEQAKQKISDYINSSIPEEITLTHNDFEIQLLSSQLSIYFNVDEAIEIAYQIGKDGNIFQKNWIKLQTLFSKINIEPRFLY